MLKHAPTARPIAEPDRVRSLYPYWRLRIFFSMYVGYASYYLTRKSITYAMPTLMKSLSLDPRQTGLLLTIFSLSYGLSKFASGIVGDWVNPRYFLPIGLMLTGICNLCFGISSSLVCFALFWGLNGWFQGFGWPSCARLLTYWYSRSERGTWWGKWNTSHNVGGAAVYLLVTKCLECWNWRAAFYIPGLLSIGIGALLIERMRDTPQSLGLPPIEDYRRDWSDRQGDSEEESLTKRERFIKFVLNNFNIWLLAISYFFLYIARTALNDWTGLYLVERKEYSQTLANACVFWFEVGGFFGGLSAGWISDRLFRSRRGPVNFLFTLAILPILVTFWRLSSYDPTVNRLLMCAAGFSIFGPQMLIGVAAAELSHRKSAASATGFTGCFAYLGAAAAGYPLGEVIDNHGWNTYYQILAICCVSSAAALLPLWRVSAYRPEGQTAP